jgi:hypothetical protein
VCTWPGSPSAGCAGGNGADHLATTAVARAHLATAARIVAPTFARARATALGAVGTQTAWSTQLGDAARARQ